MTTNETRRYMMLMRVRDFGEAHPDVRALSSVAEEQFAAVASAVTALGEHDVTKMSAARQGRVPKDAARRALFEELGAIGRTARAMAQETPGLDKTFRLPAAPSDQALLTAGRMFARDAEAFTREFVLNGMTPAFLDELQALVGQFEQAIRESEMEKTDHLGARASIEAALASGTLAVRRLDAIIANQLRRDPVTMAVWQRARRVGYPTRARRAAAPTVAAPHTTVTASATSEQA